MLVLRTAQIDAMSRFHFLARLERFLQVHARSPLLKQALADRGSTYALWNRFWPRVACVSEHDAALFLSFMLVCQAEGLDLKQAAALGAARDASAELGMKRVLSERGHLRFSDFDFSEQAAPAGV